jgi:hypothetical protein
VNGILEEAVEEAVGASSRKWALLLVAFVAGGAFALWLVRRPGGPGPSGGERSRAPAAEDRGELIVSDDSSRSWRGVIRRVRRRPRAAAGHGQHGRLDAAS